MTITAWNKWTAKSIAEEIDAALAEIAERRGIHIHVVGGRYNASTFSPKVECSIMQDGQASTPYVMAWLNCGYPKETIGKTFTSREDVFRVVGLNPKARTMPVVAKRVSDGKMFKFPMSSVESRGLVR